MGRGHVHVARERGELLDERSRGVDGSAAATGGELLDATGEHARHFDHGRAVLAVGFDVERRDDRIDFDQRHRESRGQRAVGGDVVVVDVAHENAIVAALEADHAVGTERAVDADARGRTSEDGGDDEVLTDFALGKLEVEARPHLVHAEDTGLRLGAWRDHRGVRARGGVSATAAEAGESCGESSRQATGGRLARRGLAGRGLTRRGLTGCGRAILGGRASGRRRSGCRLFGRLTRGEREPCRGQREGAKAHWT